MGVYGVGVFENDTAADWIGELEVDGCADDVRRALERVTRVSGLVDQARGLEALAAAEVVAAVREYPGDTRFTPKLARRMPELVADAPLAVAALDAVSASEHSELSLQLQDTSLFGEWQEVLADLRRRLGGQRDRRLDGNATVENRQRLLHKTRSFGASLGCLYRHFAAPVRSKKRAPTLS